MQSFQLCGVPFRIRTRGRDARVSCFMIILGFIGNCVFGFRVEGRGREEIRSAPSSCVCFTIVQISFLFVVIFPVDNGDGPCQCGGRGCSFRFIFFSASRPGFPVFSPGLWCPPYACADKFTSTDSGFPISQFE